MINGNDLFPAESRGRPAATTKASSILIQEDATALAEMQGLAAANTSPATLSKSKEVVARLMMSKRPSPGSSGLAAVFTAAIISAAFGFTFFLTGVVGPQNTKLTAENASGLVLYHDSTDTTELSKERGGEQLPAQEGASTVKENDASGIVDGGEERIELPAPPKADELMLSIAKPSGDEDQAKVDATASETSKPVSLPSNIKIVEEPFTGQIDPPEVENLSASDLIDQFGFGTSNTNPVGPVTTVEGGTGPSGGEANSIEAPGSVVEAATVIPLQKPDLSAGNGEITYRIVDRKGEKPGFWRMRGDDESTKQWFIVIEALSSDGKSFDMPVKSAATGEIKPVSKWALEITKEDYIKFSNELEKSGFITNPVVGRAASKTTLPTWDVETTGAMLTEW